MKRVLTLAMLSFMLLGFQGGVALAANSAPTELLATAESTEDDGGLQVIKPDFLPGPAENLDASQTRNYILNTSIPRVINVTIGIFGLLTFLAILIASFNLLTHFGNEEKITRAKDNLRWSIFGFALMILAYAIVSIIVSVSLPKSNLSSLFHIPTAQAVDVNNVEMLLPNQFDLIEQHDPNQRVSLPSGDLFSELIPAAITNFFFLFGFLVFVAFMVGGMMMVFGRGNEEMQSKARDIIVWGFVALVCASLGYAIIFGIATLNLDQNDQTEADDVFIQTTLDETTL